VPTLADRGCRVVSATDPQGNVDRKKNPSVVYFINAKLRPDAEWLVLTDARRISIKKGLVLALGTWLLKERGELGVKYLTQVTVKMFRARGSCHCQMTTEYRRVHNFRVQNMILSHILKIVILTLLKTLEKCFLVYYRKSDLFLFQAFRKDV
jgi:hypothetical protein